MGDPLSIQDDTTPEDVGTGDEGHDPGRTPERVARVRAVLHRRQPDLVVVVEDIRDHHNVSAILRSCDAVGVLDLHMIYTREKPPDFTRIGKRSSSGARKWIRTFRHPDVGTCYERLRQQGLRIVATQLAPDSVPMHAVDFTRPTALVFGNEHLGVSDEEARGADERMIIPMLGMVQSLNVSVAAAVTLYEAMRQRTAAGMYELARLPASVLEDLEQGWMRK